MNTKKVEAAFQLLTAAVTSIDIKNTFFGYDERNPGKKEIDVGFIIRDVGYDEEKELRLGILDLKVVVTSEVDDNNISLDMEYRGVFSAPLDMEEDAFKKMLGINGCAALYSMARATISSISSQVFSIGNIVLPMVNFIRFHEIEGN